jgi:DNA-binding NtrC family response regulator
MIPRQKQFLGSSPLLLDAIERADLVAPESLSVFIHGETGTGKELVARRIHEKSQRADGPFVTVRCGAVDKDWLRLRRFGYLPAMGLSKVDVFAEAEGGTLFLDEICDLALENQCALLQALADGEHWEREEPGANAKVRIVSSSNRDISDALHHGRLRTGLFLRLAQYQVKLPPLRERGLDIVTLAEDTLRREYPEKHLSRRAVGVLRLYPWPGNIHELQNVVCAAAIDSRDRLISEKAILDHLMYRDLLPAIAPQGPQRPGSPDELSRERQVALRAHLAARGMISVADARSLFGLQRSQALRLLKGWEAEGELVRRGRGRGSHYVAGRRGPGACPQFPPAAQY